jgi:hypothetical protein
MDYWVGGPNDLPDIVLRIAKEAKIDDHARIKALYEYAVGRAYPYGETALSSAISIPPPPVDLIARGQIDDSDRNSDQGRVNPIWNAIRSSLSAVRAAKAQARSACLSWVHGSQLMFQGAGNLVDR